MWIDFGHEKRLLKQRKDHSTEVCNYIVSKCSTKLLQVSCTEIQIRSLLADFNKEVERLYKPPLLLLGQTKNLYCINQAGVAGVVGVVEERIYDFMLLLLLFLSILQNRDSSKFLTKVTSESRCEKVKNLK